MPSAYGRPISSTPSMASICPISPVAGSITSQGSLFSRYWFGGRCFPPGSSTGHGGGIWGSFRCRRGDNFGAARDFWRAMVSELCPDDLKKIYPDPTARVIAKARPQVDIHARKFIEMSPFCVIATSGSDGSVDASPRGGHPGFVHVEGPNRLLMPDRPGNNRIDSFKNIVEGSGFVQLIFFVPGIDETLRVGGKGRLTTDPDLLASMVEFGKAPRVVLSIEVTEAYFHCGKALMRSKLWSQDAQVQRAVFPSISEVIHDQTTLGEPESQAVVAARYETQL